MTGPLRPRLARFPPRRNPTQLDPYAVRRQTKHIRFQGAIQMNLRATRCFALLLLLLTPDLAAQIARYLAIEGEGTASVLLDEAVQTAYLTDAGKSGGTGIQGALVEGMPIFPYLRSKGIKRLVITCSHPHADHMAGFLNIVRDGQIRRFDEIVFMDN